jgi:FKBP-type peptidyl-prolyl cis-trans isomerase
MKALCWRAFVLAALSGLSAGCFAEAEGERKVTRNGIRYVDLQEGTGEPAKMGDGLQFAYTGYLADGKQFQRLPPDKPASIRLGFAQPIVGLDEGMEGIKVGGKRKIWVPARMGYGVRGSPPNVPPNADLIFEVEVLRVITPEQANSISDEAKKRLSEAEKVMIDELRMRESKPPTGKDVPEKEQKEVTDEATGLKYIDQRIGDGREAVSGSYVHVLYVGRLIDGTKFDSSQNPANPFTFQLGAEKVIKGWDMGLVGMKVGGKRKLIIPPALGYGVSGAGGGKIPPNATLIFEIELLRVR